MRGLNDILSPISWLFMYLAWIIITLAIFQASAWECFSYLVVDMLAFALIQPFHIKVFFKFNPQFKEIIDTKLNILPTLKSAPFESKNRIFNLFCEFPLKWAIHIFVLSWIKCIPVYFLMLFYWDYPWSFQTQGMMIFFTLFLFFVYFFGMGFIETHIFLSKKFREEIFDDSWGNALLTYKQNLRKDKYDLIEYAVLVILFFTGVMFQAYVVYNEAYATKDDLFLKIFFIGVCSYMLFFRFRYLFQKFLLSALRELFSYMDNIEKQKYNFAIPLHTASLLNRFDVSFNSLLNKIKDNEKELTSLILVETEKSRYRTVGEMSALVLHDLANPMNILRYCSDQLVENKNILNEKPEYPDVIRQNVKRCLDLIDAFKHTLKSDEKGSRSASLIDVHTSTLRILETQYFSMGFNKVTVSISASLKNIDLHIDRTDLSQILDNLYRNAYNHLLGRAVPGTLKIYLESKDNDLVTIAIHDSGTGLTAEEFDAMISPRLTLGQKHRSMGLKLTKKLVEAYGGQLVLKDVKEGTCFLLTLPGSAERKDVYETSLGT